MTKTNQVGLRANNVPLVERKAQCHRSHIDIYGDFGKCGMYLKHFGSEVEANGLHLNGCINVITCKKQKLISMVPCHTSNHCCILVANVLGCTCGI